MTTTRIHIVGREAAGTVRVRGVLDIVSAPELGTAIGRAMRAGACRVVVDCDGLTALDQDGVRVLVNARRTLARSRQGLVLRNVPARLVDQLVAAGLAGVVEDRPRH